jgi:hypothetical protein
MQSDRPRCIEPLDIELHEWPPLEVLILAETAVPSRASKADHPIASGRPSVATTDDNADP